MQGADTVLSGVPRIGQRRIAPGYGTPHLWTAAAEAPRIRTPLDVRRLTTPERSRRPLPPSFASRGGPYCGPLRDNAESGGGPFSKSSNSYSTVGKPGAWRSDDDMSGSGPSHGYSRNNICKKTEVKFKTMLSNTIHEVDAASAGAVRSAAGCERGPISSCRLADGFRHVQVCAKRPGWKETDKDDWDFIWADKDWIRMHFDECRHYLAATVPSLFPLVCLACFFCKMPRRHAG
jgi:hypothetical protein